MLIHGKSLIENAQPPEDLFTEDELELVKQSVKVKLSKERYGKEGNLTEAERKKAGRLRDRANLNGYYPAGINEHDEVMWNCLVHPKSVKMRNVRLYLQVCAQCGIQFQAPYFDDDRPNTLCHKCDKPQRRTVQGHVPF